MLTRRRVLVPLAVMAANSLLAATIAAARKIVLSGRPAPAGTSATRCAQCGAGDHNMLDRRCPAAPRVV